MYPTSGRLVLGFHGCDGNVGSQVILGKTRLYSSENEWDWLGHGIYFWESDDRRAREYAEILKKRPRRRVNSPFVIGAIIDLGNCLDLLNRSHLELLRRSYEGLEKTLELEGKTLPVNQPLRGGTDLLLRKRDCAVINFLHSALKKEDKPPFDSVRAAFWEGEELYPNSGFRKLNHIQICVRNPNCIKGYFLPRKRDRKFPIP